MVSELSVCRYLTGDGFAVGRLMEVMFALTNAAS